MKKNFKLVQIFVLVAVLALAAPAFLSSPSALAASGVGVGGNVTCSGDVVGGICFPETNLPKNTIEGILTNAMKWLLSIFAILAIISFIIAGLQYFLAAGNPDSAKKAKQNMVYSIIGIVVALSSLVIIYAVEGFLSARTTF